MLWKITLGVIIMAAIPCVAIVAGLIYWLHRKVMDE